MARAATDIGKDFTQKCEELVHYVAAVETSGKGSNESAFAATLDEYFEYIKKLPQALLDSDSGYTALYEVDRALEGFYSEEKLQLYQEKSGELRGIIIDFSALQQKFYLLPKMAQADGRYAKLPGMDRFYTHWKEMISRDSAGGTEVERAGRIANILIEKSEYSTEIRSLLLKKLGEIVVTLGVDLDFAQSRLRNFADHIASREPFEGKLIDGDVLINLQTVHTLSGNIKDCGIPVDSLSKAIRYWSSRDEFLNNTFKQWKWNWQNDYTTHVAWGERQQLIEASELYRSWTDSIANLDIGRSYIEMQEHREKKPTELFKPIPIFILGRSNVGKSSFFTAINYELSTRGSDSSRKLTYGQQLQAYYDTSQKSWLEGKSVPTAAYSYFDFWRDLDVVGFCTYDYRGGDAEPQQWEPSLQEMFRNARGIIFMIDDDDLENPVKLRARATWSRTILDYWRNSNPQLRHVPIALVINKADLFMPEAMPVMKRSNLLPDDFQAPFVENHAISRFTVESPETATPLGRLKDCMLHDPENNVHPKLQDLTNSLAENFSQFLSRVIEVTYNYQVFLMSSRSPQPGDKTTIPWGVTKPFVWMTQILQDEHIAESVSTYESELKTIERSIEGMKATIETMQRLWDEIDDHQNEVEEERKKKIRFALKQREEQVKHLQGLINDAEADFAKRAAEFIETPPKNKEDVMAIMAKKLKAKNDMLENLRKRLKNYQMRKTQLAT